MKHNTPTDEDGLNIEGILPVKTTGIECLRESNPETMSPHRNLHKWFARRPTAATRLALLATVLPSSVSNDGLLQFMQIGPPNPEHLNEGISQYVEQKYATKDNRDGNLSEHFGYDIPHSRSPSQPELKKFHSLLRDQWDGELPTILDPTAGGGTIPLESIRYGLPTKSNELNPVAWLLNKVILDYAPDVGSLKREVKEWGERIDEKATSELTEYFPSVENNEIPSHYLRAYSIECPSCGNRLPLSNRWWLLKKGSNEGHAIRPIPHEEEIEFEHVQFPQDSNKYDFNPSEGTVDKGDAECPTCSVVIERDELVKLMSNGEYEYEVCGVRYERKNKNGSGYRAATKEDRDAIAAAAKAVDNNLELSTLLTTDRFVGRSDRAAPYGLTQWRDIYSPRQLLSHATYLQAFHECRDEIISEYDEEKATSILVILSLASSKLIERNSRLVPINYRYGAPANMLGNNNFAFLWHFGETNLTTGTYSYKSTLEMVIENYEELVGYVSEVDSDSVEITNDDAASLSYPDESIDAVVIDPPYGDNVMYAELADAFYVWLKEYLQPEFPTQFAPSETNKEDEAVENTEVVDDSGDRSRREVARERYENKMSDIFEETYRVLKDRGVLTIYFTDKETSAWDSLTMSLIRSGYTVTATHTVTSEMPMRIGMRERASADTTLLLTCRKPADNRAERTPTLWSDIRERTRRVAQAKASELLDSNINFTKTDAIIGAFGPTLRVFTEEYPVVDKHDNEVRPKEALEEARTAVTEVLVERELEESLNSVDSLTKWYVLSFLVYDRTNIPYDEARQLGMGVGVQVDDVKQQTKIWGKSKDTLQLKEHNYRVQDLSELESGAKRRTRAYPIDPRDSSFNHDIDAVHAALGVLKTKGSEFTWNWLTDRNLQDSPGFKQTIKSLLQVLPENNSDHELLVNLVSGETGDLLDISPQEFISEDNEETERTTLQDY